MGSNTCPTTTNGRSCNSRPGEHQPRHRLARFDARPANLFQPLVAAQQAQIQRRIRPAFRRPRPQAFLQRRGVDGLRLPGPLPDPIDEIDTAIIAESARWGDYLSASSARTRNTDWLPAVTWVRDTYLAQRTPSCSASSKRRPVPDRRRARVSRNGGQISSGFSLTITAAAGTIYYTTDGSDPAWSRQRVERGRVGIERLAVTLTASK